jgi:predicted nucleotidyltransferase component of viral defense system
MILPNKEQMTPEALMLWVMHRFADVFREHVILKGGMQLMLLSSQRATNDLDYVFVPYRSKKEVEPQIDQIMHEIPDASIEKTFHSTHGNYKITVGKVSIQVEFNVASKVPSSSITTELLAKKTNILPRVIRVMNSEVAFAHKLAAWNERRLIRDLYDIFYWYTHIQVMPDMEILEQRLNKVNSRLPKLTKHKKITKQKFLAMFRDEISNLTEKSVQNELRPLLPRENINGLLPVMKSQLSQLALELENKWANPESL